MFWSKVKRTSAAADVTQAERKEEPQQLDSTPPVISGDNDHEEGEAEYPGLKVVIPSVLSVCLAGFLTSLDRTIIGVAIPSISNEFGSFNDVAWYESAYLLTCAAFQLPLGKVYTFFPAKWVFIGVVVVFEIGSIVCAAAPTSHAFIVGRAIAGIGNAGTFTGSTVIFVDLLPLHKRPKYQGFLGGMFGIAAIAGPLLGGVFATKVTWRWCFWINVPIGGLAIVMLLLILPSKPPAKKHVGESFTQRLKQFDPIGSMFLLPGLVLLLLALQWAGNGYAWGSTKVVVTLVLGIALLVAFSLYQLRAGENGTVPPRIFSQRSIAVGTVVSIGLGSSLLIITFYLPIWLQAIKEKSAVSAGIGLLPYFLSTVAFVIGGGFVVSKIGYYTPPLIVGTALTVIGYGLLTTLRHDTDTGKWLGYQIITGAGLGLTLTGPINAAQTVLSREDIPIGMTILTFAQFISGTILISVCQTVLSSTLVSQISDQIPNLDASTLSGTGATSLLGLVPEQYLPVLLTAYNKGIENVFYCGLAMSGVAFVASLFMEWKSVAKQSKVTEV
ncbi:hypothetical protein MMC13_004901 [Lambiella insularis]|nr:hypothetical protein [Lambiella insularis]